MNACSLRPDALDRHIAREAIVSAIINAVISAGFFNLVFCGLPTIPFWNSGGLVADAAPQSFMVALMGTLVPGFLTRAAIRRGRLAVPASVATQRLVGQAIAVAAFAAGSGVLLATMVGLVSGGSAPFGVAAAIKILYGAALGWLVTGWSLRRLFG